MLASLARVLWPPTAAAAAHRAPGQLICAESAANAIAGPHPKRTWSESAHTAHTIMMALCHPVNSASNILAKIARNGFRAAFGPQNSAQRARTSTPDCTPTPAAHTHTTAMATACFAPIGSLCQAINPRPAQATSETTSVTSTEPTLRPPNNHLTPLCTHSVPILSPLRHRRDQRARPAGDHRVRVLAEFHARECDRWQLVVW